MALPIEEWYFEIPPVTRIYGTLVMLVTVACLYFNLRNIVYGKQYWRLLTNFLFFGNFGVDFLFHMFFMTRYCRGLEEGSFRGRLADFVWMMLLAAGVLTILAPILNVLFMGNALNYMMVYLWSRRNPDVRMNFMGFLNFNAPYLPWVLMGISFLLNNSVPLSEVLGVGVGHIYYFFDDVYPVVSRTGKRYLRAPAWFKRLVEGTRDLQVAVDGGEHPHQE